MKALLVAGARPNFVKVAPIVRALTKAQCRATLVHTGQHYDWEMSGAFFEDLGLPEPDYYLGVGSCSHAVQTARIMEAFELVLTSESPDWVVVVGDVNSTLACALVASKLKQETGCSIAHVEAGLRSGDWQMPEEVNRVLTDRLSDLLLTPSKDVHPNLISEGIPQNRVVFVGNVMIDTLVAHLPKARALDIPRSLELKRGEYAVLTIHRPSNVDDPASLRTIIAAMALVARKMPVVSPLHPRTRSKTEAFGLGPMLEALRVTQPLGYTEMLSLTDGAAVVVTDSGGLQEETTVLGVPCVTLREQTERPITVLEGTNRLAPWPLTSDGVLRTVDEAIAGRGEASLVRRPDGWDGAASERIVKALREFGTC